jgi:hypothetical protein
MGKTHRRLPYLLLFGCFLLIGFSIGRGVLDDPAESRAIRPPSGVAASQRNILVIGVDDLNARQPRLESIWLVIYLIDHPQAIFLPIYPPPTEGARTGEADPPHPSLDPADQARLPGELFKTAPDGSPDLDFLEAHQAKNLWWSGYILVDEIGMAEVVEAARKLGADDLGSTSGIRAIAEIPPAWVDPVGALAGQVELARTMCRYLKGAPSDLELSPLLDIIPRHARTDLNLTRATSELKNLLSSPGGLSCEFPTVRVSPIPAQ